jgi:FkbM family methyltransferase
MQGVSAHRSLSPLLYAGPVTNTRKALTPLLKRQALWGKIVGASLKSGLRFDRWINATMTLFRLPFYVGPMGLGTALKFVGRTFVGSGEVEVSLEGYPAPFKVRCATSDPFVFDGIFVAHAYGKARGIKAPRYILDAGAYTGYSGAYLAHHFPDAKVVCLEPEASNFKLLSHHAAAFDNLVPVNAALWKADEDVFLSADEELDDLEHWGARVGGEARASTAAVPGLTLATLAEQQGVESWDMLKIDVEGAEGAVFDETIHDAVRGAQLLFIELHEHIEPGSAAGFFAFADANPCTVEVIGDNVALWPA